MSDHQDEVRQRGGRGREGGGGPGPGPGAGGWLQRAGWRGLKGADKGCLCCRCDVLLPCCVSWNSWQRTLLFLPGLTWWWAATDDGPAGTYTSSMQPWPTLPVHLGLPLLAADPQQDDHGALRGAHHRRIQGEAVAVAAAARLPSLGEPCGAALPRPYPLLLTLLPHHHHRCCHTAASAPPLFVQDLESVQLHDYFSRFQFSVKTKRFHPEQVTVFCSCMQPENPDRPMSQVGGWVGK